MAASGPALPRSTSLDEGHQYYIDTGWYKRDFRIIEGFPRAVHKGYATDQDFITPEAMRRHPYYAEFLGPLGLQWFVAVTFNVKDQLWAASVQGTGKRGPFLSDDVDTMMRVRQELGLAARRAAAVGNQRVDSLEAAFASAQRGVVAIDAWGKISWLNPTAEEILREADLSRSGRLRSQDPLLHKRLSDLIDAAVGFRWSAGLRLRGPVRIPARDGRFFSVDAVPMPRDFQALPERRDGACDYP